MPLTFAHPAPAVPLKKAGLMLSPLVVGSIMPDFEFFLTMSTSKVIGHSLLGIFLFCVPIGLITLFIFHKILKYPLLSILPHSHQAKLLPVARQFSFRGRGRLLNIVVSLMAGAATHIAMDSFTHHNGIFVQMMPFLSAPVFILQQGTIRVYFLLQYIFSISGTAAVIYWYWSWYKGSPSLLSRIPQHPLLFCSKHKARIGLSISTFSLGGGLSFGLMTAPGIRTVEATKVFLTNSVIATGTSLLFALITFGVLWHRFVPKHRKEHFTKGLLKGQVE
ncbi:MAG: DUF4184 family protein [Chitinispirillaceae bacterium]